MTITRVICGQNVEIELTHDELRKAHDSYAHHCDYEYVKSVLKSGTAKKELAHLTDKQWDEAAHQLASEMRLQQIKNGFAASEALQKAIAWFLKKELPKWPRKRYFEIQLANADAENVMNIVAIAYCWAMEKPSREEALEFATRFVNQTFDEAFEINEIPLAEVEDWFDDPSQVPALIPEKQSSEPNLVPMVAMARLWGEHEHLIYQSGIHSFMNAHSDEEVAKLLTEWAAQYLKEPLPSNLASFVAQKCREYYAANDAYGKED